MATLFERPRALARRILIAPQANAERNIYFLYAEVIFAAILAAAGSFNSAYVLRLGGSNALIGLLSSIPSLLAMFLFIPSATILARKRDYLPWVVGSLLLTRLGYVFLALLPLVLRSYLSELSVAVLIAMAIPSVFFSTGWSPLLSDVVPVQSRATVLAWRSILSSATIAPMIYLAGRWLDAAPAPFNYQIMYAVGFIAGAVSVYLVARIRIEMPDKPPEAAPKPREPLGQALRALSAENRGFVRIVVNTFLYSLGAWMINPLFIIFYVRNLQATDGWIGQLGTLAHIGVIVGYWLWRRIIRQVGDSKALLIALPLVAIHPFLVAAFPNLTFILFVAFLINVLAPGVDLSHSVIFLDLLPAGKKHSLTAIYSTVMHVGAFVCPLIGVLLADRIGIIPTLLIGGTMRFLGAALFYLFPVKPSAGGAKPLLIPRATRGR